MAESYSIRARLSAIDSGFTSTLKNAMGSVDSLANRIKSGFAFGILTGAGQAAFNTIKNSVSGVISEIDSSNAAWKTFSSNMQIIGKSEGEIQSVKKELQSFAEQTIYSSSDMAQTYAQLAAVGTKNTTALVKGFGGLASAAENPTQAMKTLSTQATQMAAKPMVAWQDFKLMLEQTPAGMAAVAKQMGMTTQQLVSAVQDGTVATEDFFDAVQKVGTNDSFTKMATQYKTTGQAMSGLQETVGNKLTPAFDVLSQTAISGISSIIDKVSLIDGQAIADRVSGWIKKAEPYWDSFSSAVKNVGNIASSVAKKLSPIFSKLGSIIGKGFKSAMDWIAKIDAEKVADGIENAVSRAKPYLSILMQVGKEAFSVLKTGAGYAWSALQKIGAFFTKHEATIQKVLPYLLKAALAYKGFKIINSVVPGMSRFTSAIGSLAGKGISGLAGKLFGVSKAAENVGTKVSASGSQMLSGAKAFTLVGAGVLMVSAGLALLAQSAIALSSAGGPAIAVMVGLIAVIAALGVGMMVLLKTLAPMSAQLMPVALAFLAMSAAVLLISASFAFLTQTAIALTAAGLPAIAMMVSLVAIIALLAVGAALLGPALTAGAVGFIAFGAALLLVGVAAVLAATSLVILSSALPALIQYGLSGAVSILALGAALLVFGAGALVAGAGALVLGAGLMICAVAFTILGAGALLAAAALVIVAGVLPTLATYGASAAASIAILGAGLLVFGAGALVAGAGAIVLGAGLAICGAALLICAAAVLVLAAGMAVIGVSAVMAAAGLAVVAAVLPQILDFGLKDVAAMAAMCASLAAFGAAALVAGAGAAVLGAGLMVVGAAVMIVSAGMAIISASAMIAAAALQIVTGVLPLITMFGSSGAAALVKLGASLVIFGAGAAVAATATLTLAAGLVMASTSSLILGAGLMVIAAAFTLIKANAITALTALRMITAVLPTIAAVAAQNVTQIAALGLAFTVFGAGAAIAGAAALALGGGLMVALLSITMFTTAVKALSMFSTTTATSLMAISHALPLIVLYANSGANAFRVLGQGMVTLAMFSIPAAAAMKNMATVLAAMVMSVVVGNVAFAALAASVMTLAHGSTVTAMGLTIIATVLPLIVSYSSSGSIALLKLGTNMAIFSAYVIKASNSITAFSTGLVTALITIIMASAAIQSLGAGLKVVATASTVSAMNMVIIVTMLAMIVSLSSGGYIALSKLGIGLTIFGTAAITACEPVIKLTTCLMLAVITMASFAASTFLAVNGMRTLLVLAMTLGFSLGIVRSNLTNINSLLPSVRAGAVSAGAGFSVLKDRSASLIGNFTMVMLCLLSFTAAIAVATGGMCVFGSTMASATTGVVAMSVALMMIRSTMRSISTDAQQAAQSLDNMQRTVGTVEGGLKSLTGVAESTMNAFLNVFRRGANSSRTIGTDVAKNFVNAIKLGLLPTKWYASSAVNSVVSALRSGRSGIYNAGAYISQGFAQGMLSQLGVIQNAAARIAAAADKAVRAKARIASPSKVAKNLGAYWGSGYVNGILSTVKDAWNAAQQLVTVPSMDIPDFAMAYNGGLSSEYSYSGSASYTIDVPLEIDGREFARATVTFTQDEINRRERTESRKKGRL